MELVGRDIDSTGISIVVYDVIHVRVAFGRTNTRLFNCERSAGSSHVFDLVCDLPKLHNGSV